MIPTEITMLTYTAPGPVLSQNGAAEVLAHYWPALQAHFYQQAADVLQETARDLWAQARIARENL